MNIVGTSNERNRVEWLRKNLKKIQRGKKILDAGAGEQQFKKFCSHLKYISQDIAVYDGQGDEKGLQTKKWDFGKLDIVSDIVNIPVSDKSFDAVMCTEVLEHIPEPVLAIKEFSRILKRKGVLIITAPFCSLSHFAPFHYSTGFNRYFYEKILADHGFEIKEIKENGNYFEYLAQELRRLPNIARKYTHGGMSRWEGLAIRFLLFVLNRLSSQDKKSKELLCFGYHVLAVKK